MNITVSVKVQDELVSAINNLAAAFAAAGPIVSTEAANVTPRVEKAEAKTSAKTTRTKAKTEEKGPFLYANHSTGEFGSVDTKAEYDALKAEDSDIVRVTQAQYDALAAKAEAGDDEAEAKAEAKKAEAKKTESKKTEKAKTEKSKSAAPSKAELVETFRGFLPEDLDAEERAERRQFIAALLQRYGVERVRDLAEAHWGEAVDLIQRKLAGEDIDPTAANLGEGQGDEDDYI